MDVYHRVLIKLYEVTGGRENETVDLKELVKKEGFLGAYPEIHQHLSRQSWITETPRPGTVKITHWGVKEAKNTQPSDAGNVMTVRREINRLVAETRELIRIFEELAADASSDNIVRAEKKAAEISSAIQKLKNGV
ncbi:MAG: hypothetical protein JSS81_01830 [Acidobacteria bacterium]|nr:hypothetical protein [Acidobacteriota bacterium]